MTCFLYKAKDLTASPRNKKNTIFSANQLQNQLDGEKPLLHKGKLQQLDADIRIIFQKIKFYYIFQ
jgi:hypothetical protein